MKLNKVKIMIKIGFMTIIMKKKEMNKRITMKMKEMKYIFKIIFKISKKNRVKMINKKSLSKIYNNINWRNLK